jgi:hypothetical protein
MKKPRIEDFDPGAVPELGSPLDNLPTIERPRNVSPVAPRVPPVHRPPLSPHAPDLEAQIVQDLEPSVRSIVRTNQPSKQRTKVRHTFDIFSDQLVSLKELALARERLVGQRTRLGDLVQEALDNFIAKDRTR